MVCNAYGDTIDDVAPVTAGSGLSCLVEDDDDWNSDDIALPRNADVCTCLRFNFYSYSAEMWQVEFCCS